jgi:hypothetical protein
MLFNFFYLFIFLSILLFLTIEHGYTSYAPTLVIVNILELLYYLYKAYVSADPPL